MMSNPFFLFPGFEIGGASPDAQAPAVPVDLRAAAEAEGLWPPTDLKSDQSVSAGLGFAEWYSAVADVLPSDAIEGSGLAGIEEVATGLLGSSANVAELVSDSAINVGVEVAALAELGENLEEQDADVAHGLDELSEADSVSHSAPGANLGDVFAPVASLLVQALGSTESVANASAFEMTVQQSSEQAALQPVPKSEQVTAFGQLAGVEVGTGQSALASFESKIGSEAGITYAEVPNQKTATNLEKDTWFAWHYQSTTAAEPTTEVAVPAKADDVVASTTVDPRASSKASTIADSESKPLVENLGQGDTATGSEIAELTPTDRATESSAVERDRMVETERLALDYPRRGEYPTLEKISAPERPSSAETVTTELQDVAPVSASESHGNAADQSGRDADSERLDESLLATNGEEESATALRDQTESTTDLDESAANLERIRVEANSVSIDDSLQSTPLSQKAVEPAFTLTSDASALGVSIHQEQMADAVAADQFAEEIAFFEESLAIDELFSDASADGLDSAADVLRRAAETSMRQEGRTIQLELSPAELGTLKIQVLQTEHSIKTQIVATEAVASELLNAHREQLTAALQSLGFDTSEVEVSHQPTQDTFSNSSGSFDQSGEDARRRDVVARTRQTPYPSQGNSLPNRHTSAGSSNGGLNLIA